MIPEAVPSTTSVTTGRPASYDTPLGRFEYRHIQVGWFLGYAQTDVGKGQSALIAAPEKALLDLVYLHPGADTEAYLVELRLQALGKINLEVIVRLARLSGKPKLVRAAKVILRLVAEEARSYESL